MEAAEYFYDLEAIDAPAASAPYPVSDQPETYAAADATSVDALQLFRQQAGNHPLLTAEEEVELAKRIEKGDLEAKDRLVTHNLRLVMSVADRYQGLGLDLLDLYQEGSIGLIRGVEKFDWRRGYKFSSYGTLWIQNALQRALYNKARAIRVPRHVEEQAYTARKAQQHLESKLGRDATPDEIAAATEFTSEQIVEFHRMATQPASLNTPVGDDGSVEFGEFLPAPDMDIAEHTAQVISSQNIQRVVAAIPDERGRAVIKRNFGIGAAATPEPISEIAADLGVSPQYASKLKTRWLAVLAGNQAIKAERE